MKVFMEGGCPLVAEPEINERTCQKNDRVPLSLSLYKVESGGKMCKNVYRGTGICKIVKKD